MVKKKNPKNRDSKLNKTVVQFAEYMFTGGVWFWSGYIIIITLDNHIGLFWANLIGNSVGISLNFILEKYWVFRTNKQTKLGVMAGRYVIYTVLNAFLLNYFILWGLQKNGIEPEVGQFIASGFFTLWNYYWYKAWVFKNQQKPRRTRHHA